MSLRSFGSTLVWLVVGCAIGFVVAQKTQEKDLSPSAVSKAKSISASDVPAMQVPSDSVGAQSKNLPLAKIDLESKGNNNGNVVGNESVSATSLSGDDLIFDTTPSNPFTKELVLINKIANTDFDQLEFLALELIDQPATSNNSSHGALRLITLRMLEIDKTRTFDFLKNALLDNSVTSDMFGMREMQRFESLRETFVALAVSHGDELLAWTNDMKESGFKYRLQEMVYASIARDDPRRALAQLDQNNTDSREMGTYAILSTWAETDPQAAMQWAMEQPSSERNMGAPQTIFMTWLQTDSDAANAFLESVSDPELKSVLEMESLMILSQLQPQVAMQKAMNLTDPEARRSAIEMSLYNWGNQSLLEAVDFVTNSLSGGEQQMAYQILGSSVSMGGNHGLGQSPQEIILATESLPIEMREVILTSTMSQYMQQDSQAAMQLLDSVTDERTRETLLSSVAWELPEYDLVLAQSLFEQSNDSIKEALAMGITQKLYESDPASAWSWYEEIDSVAIRESVYFSLVYAEGQTNPDEAMRLALSVTSGNGEELAVSVFNGLVYENPEWAKNWLDNANLDAATRDNFQQVYDSANDMRGFDHYQGGRFNGIEPPFLPNMEY